MTPTGAQRDKADREGLTPMPDGDFAEHVEFYDWLPEDDLEAIRQRITANAVREEEQ